MTTNQNLAIGIEVTKVALDVVTDEFDAFVAACVGQDGQPKAPDKKALMRARSMLPPRCQMTLTKKGPDQ